MHLYVIDYINLKEARCD